MRREVAINAAFSRTPSGRDPDAFAEAVREVEGFETGEICKILDGSVTNFGAFMHRARVRLREGLEARAGACHDLVQRGREAGCVGSASGAELLNNCGLLLGG
jgi:hypothetical protein